jgi:hypothetical protein
MIRISRNTDLTVIHDFILDVDIMIGIGNRRAISTSLLFRILYILYFIRMQYGIMLSSYY